MRDIGAALFAAALCCSTAALAESGSAVNVHVEPEVAVPVADPLHTPVGQGVSFKVDVPLYKGLALQANGTALSFRAQSTFLGSGSGIGGGLGLRYRLLDDREGYLLHVGPHARGHRGNLFGNLWVDANAVFLGGSGRVRPGFDAGLGAEASLIDGIQLGPFARFAFFGEEKIALFGLSVSVGVPDDTIHDLDLDKDGILEPDDQCPDDPEDKDGFEDADGCPDKDNDQDQIPDAQDRCPDTPEDKDGFEDTDGCPDKDNDRDGLADGVDHCPLVAEDKDGFEDGDGCPDGDNDQDGLADEDDHCPFVAEDKDGFEDGDGCPDPDNDQDGIADEDDQCPLQPETRNGIDDEDGCPEKEAKAYVENQQIVITDKIFFGFNRANILRKSFPLLDNVAQVLEKFPQIKRLRVEGHTDDVGSDAYNQKLSEKRARAVVDYLVKKGISPDRLEFKGYGKSRPLAEGKDEAAREKNRRVGFTIVDPEGGVVPVVINPSGAEVEGAPAQQPGTPAPAAPAPAPTDGGTPAPTDAGTAQ